MPICVQCSQDLGPNEFEMMPSGNLRKKCTGCRIKVMLERKAKDPKRDSKRRDSHLRYNFGIALRDYETMYRNQNGCCAICLRPYPMPHGDRLTTLHVDHDHVTGKVRGLLCRDCNLALGHMADNPVRLEAAAKYLQSRM